MINYETLRNTIIAGLHHHTNYPIVPAEQTANKPPYPYVSYKFTSLYIPEPGFKAKENQVAAEATIKTTHTDQPHVEMSVTAISRDDVTSADLISKIYDWFTVHGYSLLKAENIVVIETMAITDRTSLIVDDYEQKFGFDVRLRVLDTIETTIEAIKTVVTFKED